MQCPPRKGKEDRSGTSGGEVGRSRSWFRAGVPSPFTPPVERVIEKFKASVGLCRLVALGQPLHEVHLTLMLTSLGALAGAPLAGEGHVPSFILGILQCCVVVLQHNLRKDTVLAFAIALQIGTRGEKQMCFKMGYIDRKIRLNIG